MSLTPITYSAPGITTPTTFVEQYLNLDGQSDLTFANLTFKNCGQIRGANAKNITFQNCKFIGCSPDIIRFVELHPGNDGWRIKGCYFSDMPNAVYSLCDGGLIGAERVTVRDSTFERIGLGAKDGHCVGLQGGSYHKVVNNHMTDCGTAIALWAPRKAIMTNAYITKNTIRQCHILTIATGSGIEFSGDTGATRGTRLGSICKHNDIAGCEGFGISTNWPDEIVGLSNNTIQQCERGNYRVTGL